MAEPKKVVTNKKGTTKSKKISMKSAIYKPFSIEWE